MIEKIEQAIRDRKEISKSNSSSRLSSEEEKQEE